MDTYNFTYENINNIAIKGIGEVTKKNLLTLGLNNIYDILYYFPRAYEDRTNIKKIKNLSLDEFAVVVCEVIAVNNIRTRGKKTMTKARVIDSSGFLDIVWFQMPYIKKQLKVGTTYAFIGKTNKKYKNQMINPEYKDINKKDISAKIIPIYPSNKNFKQNYLRKIIDKIINEYIEYFKENLPQEVIDTYKLIDRKKAITELHFPTNDKSLEEARNRMAVEELLLLEFGIISKKYKSEITNKNKYKIENKKDLVIKFLSELNFDLTKAQKKVITDIYKELNSGKIINRLIQGDVGSGKTIVAIIVLLYMVENSFQGAFMAPTEVLAIQHYLTIVESLESIGIKVELLTGAVKGKKEKKILSEIKSGLINIVIGTHALIENDIVFKNLGLTIIDEQHRFGVIQREKLRNKSYIPNLIVMSATPIPRSLALTFYGDLDVSIIDELPVGRKNIKTKWLQSDKNIKSAYSFIEKKINEGRQAYFIAPVIDENNKLNLSSVTKIYNEIKNRFPSYKIALLHGRLKNNEKSLIMNDFKNKEYDILISTTIIEVGIDVPNATIITIVNAERFGLSTLHQLRGRVGRGKYRSYCFLLAQNNTEISEKRLSIMEKTNNGFIIAEEDLKLRKAGEVFGTKQSGLSDLKFVDIIHDIKTIKKAREITNLYLEKNNGEISNEYMLKDIEYKFLKYSDR